jgi:hypothetical protein
MRFFKVDLTSDTLSKPTVSFINAIFYHVMVYFTPPPNFTQIYAPIPTKNLPHVDFILALRNSHF